MIRHRGFRSWSMLGPLFFLLLLPFNKFKWVFAHDRLAIDFKGVIDGAADASDLRSFEYGPEDGPLEDAILAWVTAKGFEKNPNLVYFIKQQVYKVATTGRVLPLSIIRARLSESTSFQIDYYTGDDLDEVLEPFRAQYGLALSDMIYIRALIELQRHSSYPPLPLDVLLPSYAARLDSVATAHVVAAERAFIADALGPGLPVQSKLTEHAYEYVYAKYLSPLRGQAFKLLEIGLGPEPGGSSALLWRRLFPEADVYAAEFLAINRESFLRSHPISGIRVLVGDQSNESDLRRWISEMGGPADVIIDDGGHSNKQQLTSLMVLFNEGLKPGGIYVIEDLQVAYGPEFQDLGGVNQTTAILAGLMEAHVLGEGDGQESLSRVPGRLRGLAAHWRLEGLKSIDCFPEACVLALVKCAGSDRCSQRWPFWYPAGLSN